MTKSQAVLLFLRFLVVSTTPRSTSTELEDSARPSLDAKALGRQGLGDVFRVFQRSSLRDPGPLACMHGLEQRSIQVTPGSSVK